MADNIVMLFDGRWAMYGAFILMWLISGISQTGRAQVDAGDRSWTTSSEQRDPSGAVNPTRTSITHSEVNGRVIEKTVVEALGPDGRYIPYSEIERESVRVNDTTVRNVERSYGRTPDGQRTLTQETQEESRSFPDGARRVNRTISNPDANGLLRTVQREVSDSKQVRPGVRETKTTVYSPDMNGGLAPTMQIEQRERQSDASTVEFSKSTRLSDGSGHWNLGEVREGTTRTENGAITKDERVLRPNAEGNMALVERTVSRQADAGAGEKRDRVETYSSNVPGLAGENGLQLVQRESTVRRTSAAGAEATTRTVERSNPGNPSAGLRVTEQAIDIVRPGANGVAQHQSSISTSSPDGHMNTVWIDVGKSDKPATVQVETLPATKAKTK
jgi:hypothetical protein